MKRCTSIAICLTLVLLTVLTLRAAAADPAPLQAAEAAAGDLVKPAANISLPVGRSTIIQAPWPVKTVSVTDPDIANVEVLTAQRVLVFGKAVGSTDVTLLSRGDDQAWQARVDVNLDIERIKSDVARLFADASLQLGQSGKMLVVTGQLARAEQNERLHKLLDAYAIKYVDMTSLAGIQQVQLQVRVAEASRTSIRALGINALNTGTEEGTFFGASLIGSSGGGAINPVNIGPPQGSLVGPDHASPFTVNSDVTVSPLVTLLAGFPRANLEFFIQALAENQYLRILAEPNLVALSGQEANFLAGGEFPIPVVQGTVGGGTGTAITIEYKEFGVRLKFRPTVLGDNSIRLQVSPEVSELSDSGAVEIQGFRIPAIVSRRVQTTLELHSGQTFAIAGLLQERNLGRTSRVPGLGDIPVIGSLMRSTRYEKGETELVVLVTAELVEPLSTKCVPLGDGLDHAVPNDWQLYGMGQVEGTRPPKLSPRQSAQLKSAGLDRLKGPGAWEPYDSLDQEKQENGK